MSFVTRFLFLHLITFFLIFTVDFKWELLYLFIFMHFFKTIGITVGFHRYFSHRSFKTSRFFQLILGIWGTFAGQRGPLWWAAIHRNHHSHSDTEKDFHSPVTQGFWNSHIGWLLNKDSLKTHYELVKDFKQYPEINFINNYPNIVFGFLLLILFLLGGLPYLVWGGLAATIFQCHCTLAVNSIAHMYGKRVYQNENDHSGNLPWLAFLSMGEGWHNNHHKLPHAANFSHHPWQIDMGHWVIRLFEVLNIVWDVKKINPSMIKV